MMKVGKERKVGRGQLELGLGQPVRPRLAQLTDRDQQAIAWLVEQRAATIPQITELLGRLGDGPITDRRGTMLIARWEELGLVERQSIWHRQPAVCWPTTAGARLCGATRWRRPSIGTLRHTITVSGVRLRVCRPGSNRGWLTELDVRRQLPAGVRIPDGAIIDSPEAKGSPPGLTAVEVELTSHGRRRVHEAMVDLTTVMRPDGEHFFHHVLYLVSPQVMTQVNAVRNELPDELRSRVVVLPCPM